MKKDENECTQLNVLKEYQFEQTPVVAGNVHTAELIALKPIIENLGLNWSGAHQKINRDENLLQLCVSAKVTAGDGKQREMLCLKPSDFQNWLYDLNSQSDKFNIALWEQYKKGLVIYLLEMLKVSLDEVKRLRNIDTEYITLKKIVTNYINANEQGKTYTRMAKEKFKESIVLQKSILERMDEKDLAQLKIF